MHKVLNASNYKSLVHDIYLVVDSGWEEHPSSSLHYPVMQIVDGKAVYNRGGLTSALGRAQGQNETGVVSKINGLYEKLGLNSEKKEMAMTKEEELAKMAAEEAEAKAKEEAEAKFAAEKAETEAKAKAEAEAKAKAEAEAKFAAEKAEAEAKAKEEEEKKRKRRGPFEKVSTSRCRMGWFSGFFFLLPFMGKRNQRSLNSPLKNMVKCSPMMKTKTM